MCDRPFAGRGATRVARLQRRAVHAAEKLAQAAAPRDPSRVSRTTLLLERILPIGILAVALIGAPIMIFAPEGLPRMRAVEKELADVEEDNAQIRREIEALRGGVARL